MSNNIGRALHKLPDPRKGVPSPLLVRNDVYIGVELELEDMPFDTQKEGPLVPHWQKDVDNSLRGDYPYEFRFGFPYVGEDIVDALEEFDTFVRGKTTKPSCNERTSVHVHMDVRNLTARQLFNLVTVYIATEHLLYNYVAPSREENIFCLPMYKADTEVKWAALLSAALYSDTPQTLNMHSSAPHNKYGGLNIGVMYKQGSIEFRMHQGEWAAAPLLKWINILLCLYDFAEREEIDIAEFPTKVSDMGPLEFAHQVFGDYTDTLLYQSCAMDIIEDVRRAQELLYKPELDWFAQELPRIVGTEQGDFPSKEEVMKNLQKTESPLVKIRSKEGPADPNEEVFSVTADGWHINTLDDLEDLPEPEDEDEMEDEEEDF